MNSIKRKRAAQLLSVSIVLLMLLITTVAFAAMVSQYINAEKGDIITISKGIQLVIPPKALQSDTGISVKFITSNNKNVFYFSLDDITSFSVVGEGKWFLAELCTYLLHSTQFSSAKNHLPSPTENNFHI